MACSKVPGLIEALTVRNRILSVSTEAELMKGLLRTHGGRKWQKYLGVRVGSFGMLAF